MNYELTNLRGMASHSIGEYRGILRQSSPPPSSDDLRSHSANLIQRKNPREVLVETVNEQWVLNLDRGNHFFSTLSQESKSIPKLLDKLCRAEGSDCFPLVVEDVLTFFSFSSTKFKKEGLVAQLLIAQIKLELERGKAQGNYDSLLRESSLALQVFTKYQNTEFKRGFEQAMRPCLILMDRFHSFLPLTIAKNGEGSEKLVQLCSIIESYLQGLLKSTKNVPEGLKSVYREVASITTGLGPAVSKEQMVGLFFLRGANPILTSNWAVKQVRLEEREKVHETLVTASKVVMWIANNSNNVGSYAPLFEDNSSVMRAGMVDAILTNLLS